MPTLPIQTPRALSAARGRSGVALQRQGALLALLLLLLFGWLRYDNFLSDFNLTTVLAENAKFGLIALGMTFVIMTGGIDLSVGSVAALSSVIAAKASGGGVMSGLAAGIAVGALVGLLNGGLVTKLKMQPFIVTLATLLGVRGIALILSNRESVSVSFDGGFVNLGEAKLLGRPLPVVILFVAFVLGAIMLRYSRFGRHVLAVGGNEEAARLMGLPVDRVKITVYVLSGALAGLAGSILAAQTYAGQPSAGVGWELSAIAAVVVGGTLLTGGLGSVGATLVGVLLLGLIFNILNFENGKGVFSLSSYWQNVIRGAFLLLVVLLQTRLSRRLEQSRGT